MVLRLHDGRRIGVAEFGTRSSLPVVYLHGFIGSRLEPGAARIDGTNIISIDRPGYGRTDLQRLPSLCAWGADVAEALVQLGVSECIVVGVSTGAPYALAVAAALGPRVRRVILAGGIAGPEVIETAGGTALALSMIGRRGSRTGRVLHRLLRIARATRLDRRFLARIVASEREPLERQGLSLEVVHARLLQSFRAGNRRGLRGALADARLVAQPWDFKVADLQAEVLILHGTNNGTKARSLALLKMPEGTATPPADMAGVEVVGTLVIEPGQAADMALVNLPAGDYVLADQATGATVPLKVTVPSE